MTVAAIIAIIQADKVLKRLREKILSNRGTFRDTFEYSNRAAELLGANFSESVLAMSLDDRVSACVELLRDRYDDIMPLLDAVQKRADLKNKLTIAPKHPPFNAERAEQIGTSLRDLSVSDERIQRRARSAPATATRAIHDDYIEANVELRSSAGIKCYITRVTDGNCCDWCTRVAGRYEYGTEPEGIFHRHDNCGCSVTYENGRERQDVWSKKTWTVPEDAGAPEPVRLTKEQAAAAGAEPPKVFSVGEARELNDVKVKENTAKPEDVYNSSIDKSAKGGIIKTENLKMSAPLQKPPDFSKYEVKSDLKAVEAFKETVSAKLGIPISDISLDGIRNTEVLEPFINRIEQIQKETGMKMPALRSLSVIDGDETCIAGYKRYENTLYISSKYFNSKDALVDTLKEWANNGTLPKQGKTIRYLAEHETAHIRIPVSDIESEEGFEIFRKAMKRGLCENDKNIYEFYADCEALDRMGYSDKNIQDAVEYLKRRRKK